MTKKDEKEKETDDVMILQVPIEYDFFEYYEKLPDENDFGRETSSSEGVIKFE